jgi:hypothetical protein
MKLKIKIKKTKKITKFYFNKQYFMRRGRMISPP